jgi:hypothetical protein
VNRRVYRGSGTAITRKEQRGGGKKRQEDLMVVNIAGYDGEMDLKVVVWRFKD